MKKIKLHIFAIGIITLLGSKALFDIKDKKKLYIPNESNVSEAEKCIFTIHL